MSENLSPLDRIRLSAAKAIHRAAEALAEFACRIVPPWRGFGE